MSLVYQENSTMPFFPAVKYAFHIIVQSDLLKLHCPSVRPSARLPICLFKQSAYRTCLNIFSSRNNSTYE